MILIKFHENRVCLVRDLLPRACLRHNSLRCLVRRLLATLNNRSSKASILHMDNALEPPVSLLDLVFLICRMEPRHQDGFLPRVKDSPKDQASSLPRCLLDPLANTRPLLRSDRGYLAQAP